MANPPCEIKDPGTPPLDGIFGRSVPPRYRGGGGDTMHKKSEKRGENKQSFLREVKRSTRPTAEPSAQRVRIYSIQVPIQGLRLVELNKRGARFFPPWTATKTRGKAESLISMRKAGWVCTGEQSHIIPVQLDYCPGRPER